MQRFTREELVHFNGRGGSPAYIAYGGKVYDVSGSFLWRGGKHWVRHFAGMDHTGSLGEAPHNADLLERFPVIGILIESEPGDA